MKADKIIHQGEERIKIDFPFNQAIASKLRQIIGAKWSATFKAWHIPYTKADFGQLRVLFPDIEFPEKISTIQEKNSISKIK